LNDGFLKGKVALVTGGGRGIGRATAMRLAREGAAVAICARTETELRETAEWIRSEGGVVDYFIADLGVPVQIRSMVDQILGRHRRMDYLINNASLLGPKVPVSDYPLEEWEEVLKVNLTGLFLVTQAVLKPMMAQKSGCIIHLTSTVGRAGRALWGAYAVSKFGVEGLTQVLAEEVRDYNIRVMALNPGATRTRMRAEAYPEEDPATLKPPEEDAEAIYRLILNDDRTLSGKSLDAKRILAEWPSRPERIRL
jgi:NAD(P)-dependent dehydrogenase (short-subunit alcohol dehydrogenase family)